MTVQNLIEALKQLPGDLEVYDDGGNELTEVELFRPDEDEQMGGWTERVELIF